MSDNASLMMVKLDCMVSWCSFCSSKPGVSFSATDDKALLQNPRGLQSDSLLGACHKFYMALFFPPLIPLIIGSN